ncbi:hypothetical protein [Streptomyces sp. NPDC000618]|uniref:hypothetical protein n=1 Tax=Streptomyces sp. NPDC000618 TaxID=3154265 RepID=UPI00331AAB07
MSLDVRLVKVVDLLLSLTEAGHLEWESIGNPRIPKFATSLSDASFVVYSKDSDGLAPYVLEIQNSRGETVESIRTQSTLRRPREDPELAINVAARDEMRAFNQKLHALYNKARRIAMNVDEFLDGLLQQLESQHRATEND